MKKKYLWIMWKTFYETDEDGEEYENGGEIRLEVWTTEPTKGAVESIETRQEVEVIRVYELGNEAYTASNIEQLMKEFPSEVRNVLN